MTRKQARERRTIPSSTPRLTTRTLSPTILIMPRRQLPLLILSRLGSPQAGGARSPVPVQARAGGWRGLAGSLQSFVPHSAPPEGVAHAVGTWPLSESCPDPAYAGPLTSGLPRQSGILVRESRKTVSTRTQSGWSSQYWTLGPLLKRCGGVRTLHISNDHRLPVSSPPQGLGSLKLHLRNSCPRPGRVPVLFGRRVPALAYGDKSPSTWACLKVRT